MRFTVLFVDPYWIGLLENERDGRLFAAKFIFGPEPSDGEIAAFVLSRDYDALARSIAHAPMDAGVPIESAQVRPVNFKRMQRTIRQQIDALSVSSKAHEAMRLQIEQHKQARRVESKAEREAEKARKRQIALDKAKAKHRGH
ncbi:MAG: YjdF family protein [Anaerolineae bacterium]